MKVEHRIVLNLCKDLNDIQVNLSKNELKSLNWIDILWLISQHKIECLLSKKTINNISWSDINKVVGRDLKCKYMTSMYRNSFVYKKVIPELVYILDSISVEYAFTKGVVNATTLYGNIGERYFGDIDLLIRKNDLKRVKKAFVSSGYKCGEFCFSKGRIIEPKPQTVKFFEMTTHQTYPYSKTYNDIVCDHIEVDINFGLGPNVNLKDSYLIEKILKKRQIYNFNNVDFYGLSKEDLILHCCLEIFRDSTAIFHIKDYDDLKLYQFVELYRMIRKWSNLINWEYLTEVTKEFVMEEQVYYSLYYCSELFDDIKQEISTFLSVIEPLNIEYLEKYGMENKETGKWSIPFIDRIFRIDRYDLIKHTVEKGRFEEFKKREEFMERNKS